MAAVVLLLLSLASPVAAQVPRLQLGTWQPMGFEGTRVDALAVAEEGRILYVATEQGLQASLDGGENWNYIGRAFDDLGAPPVVSLAIDTRDCDCLYAGTEPGPMGGLYVSRDGGLHWHRLFAGRRDDGVRAILAPGVPGLIYLSTNYHDGIGDELLVTNNGGQTWRTLLSDSGWHAQKFYAIVPGEDGRLFVPSSLGVLVSRDGGEQFRNTSDPQLPTYSLVARPRGQNDRYGLVYAAGQRGIVASFDDGSTWRSVGAPVTSACHVYGPGSLVAPPAAVPVLLAATRSICENQPARIRALATSQGTRSQSWVDAGAGLPALPEYRLVVAGSSPPRAYALTASGLWALDLPAPPSPPTATPATGPTAAAEDAPLPAPAPVQVPEGEVKETAVGNALDYALVFVALPVGAFFALRWLRRRAG